jgi:hypothetical protein
MWLTGYNTMRRHSWCRYHSPSAYETSCTATLPRRVITPRVHEPGVGPEYQLPTCSHVHARPQNCGV